MEGEIVTQPAQKRPRRILSKGEEIFNAVTHIGGAVFGAVILVFGVVLSALYNDAFAIVAMAIFGTSVILAYLASAIYHFLPLNRAKKVFRVLDHCSIFLLIVGTYTPFCLITLRTEGAWGWTIFGVLWGLTIIGITSNAINMHNRYVKILSQVAYLAMGWIAVIAIVPIVQNLPLAAILWALAGGVSYTVGVPFYIMGRHRKNFHCLWHIFVLLGTVFLTVPIFWYVVL